MNAQPEHVGIIRVLVVDDHDLFRTGLASLLGSHMDIEVVAQASGGRMGVRLAQELSPDVVLMDLRMPDLEGAEATRAIMASHPGRRMALSPSRRRRAGCGSPGGDRDCVGARTDRRSLAEGARRAAADCARNGERGDRRGAEHKPPDGQESRLQHPREARPAEPDSGCDFRGPPPPGIAGAAPYRPSSGAITKPSASVGAPAPAPAARSCSITRCSDSIARLMSSSASLRSTSAFERLMRATWSVMSPPQHASSAASNPKLPRVALF